MNDINQLPKQETLFLALEELKLAKEVCTELIRHVPKEEKEFLIQSFERSINIIQKSMDLGEQNVKETSNT